MVSVPAEFWVVVAGLFGAIWGSYANMAAYRLPRNISTITRTRSFCPACQHQLAWYDNLPILSFLTLLGRCRYCRKPIPIRYLLVELIVAGLFVAAAYQFFVLNFGLGPQLEPATIFAVQLFLIVDLVLLSVVDLETWLIPVQTTIPWIVVGLLAGVVFPDIHPAATMWTRSPSANAFLDSFEGLVLGAGVPWTINFVIIAGSFLWFRLHGSQARPIEGMGEGDSHLLGMVGAMLGWKAALATLFVGIFFGCAAGIGKILWSGLQKWRLGGKYRPWQPTFDLPPGDGGKPALPSYWPLLAMGIIVLIAVVWLWQQSTDTFGGVIYKTMEEAQQRFGSRHFTEEQPVDWRLVPVWAMLCIGALQLVAYPFMKYLAATGNLPQGEIVENEKGEKQEVITQFNYIPFGPSLAAAALLVTFYDPLIRTFAFWWLVQAGTGPLPQLPYHLLGESWLVPSLVVTVTWLTSSPLLFCGVTLVLAFLALAYLMYKRSRAS
jgi:leader peptidase (prepilin peptidase)/N-methyltransferase